MNLNDEYEARVREILVDLAGPLGTADGIDRAMAHIRASSTIREPVLWFACEMERVLRKHDATKGGQENWREDDATVLANRAVEEALELFRATCGRGSRAIIDEAADTANMAMMVADRTRATGPPESGQPPAHDEHGASCYDCNRPYGHEHGFPDLIIPYRVWKEITPTQDDGGLLCPSCICKRLHDRGMRCEGAFMSGPIQSVSRATMSALRGVENIELAIEGRDNRWAGVRELATGEPDAVDIVHSTMQCAFCRRSTWMRDWHGGKCPECGRRASWAAPEVPA